MELDLAAIHGGRAQIVDEPRLHAMLLLGGWVHSLDDPDRARLAANEAQAVIDALVAAGLPHVAGGEHRRFDAYQATNAVRWAGRHARSGALRDVWHERFVATGRRTAATLARHARPQRFSIVLRRTIAVHADHGDPVRIRVPIPLEDGGQSAIAVEAVTQNLVEPLRHGDGWAEARVRPQSGAGGHPPLSPRSGTAELAIRVGVTVAPVQPVIEPERIRLADVDPEKAELYGRRRDGLIVVTPAIASLAAELAGSIHDPWSVLKRFWRFLFTRLQIGPLYHATLPAADPLAALIDGGWADCYAATALLVALCRASGIPARMVGGYFLYPCSPTNHYWAEVLLPPFGWVPFDLSCWEFAAGDPDDPVWADYFFGWVDPRLVTERLPRQFTSRRGLAVPRDVVLLQAAVAGGGVDLSVYGVTPPAFVYSDRVEVDFSRR